MDCPWDVTAFYSNTQSDAVTSMGVIYGYYLYPLMSSERVHKIPINKMGMYNASNIVSKLDLVSGEYLS